MSDTNPVDEINRIFAEVLSDRQERYYECVCCDTVFDSGRTARQHAITEHDDLSCYRSRTVGGDE